jgi:hypothetical protein
MNLIPNYYLELFYFLTTGNYTGIGDINAPSRFIRRSTRFTFKKFHVCQRPPELESQIYTRLSDNERQLSDRLEGSKMR